MEVCHCTCGGGARRFIASRGIQAHAGGKTKETMRVVGEVTLYDILLIMQAVGHQSAD